MVSRDKLIRKLIKYKSKLRNQIKYPQLDYVVSLILPERILFIQHFQQDDDNSIPNQIVEWIEFYDDLKLTKKIGDVYISNNKLYYSVYGSGKSNRITSVKRFRKQLPSFFTRAERCRGQND